jgi:hypothetical protein
VEVRRRSTSDIDIGPRQLRAGHSTTIGDVRVWSESFFAIRPPDYPVALPDGRHAVHPSSGYELFVDGADVTNTVTLELVALDLTATDALPTMHLVLGGRGAGDPYDLEVQLSPEGHTLVLQAFGETYTGMTEHVAPMGALLVGADENPTVLVERGPILLTSSDVTLDPVEVSVGVALTFQPLPAALTE